MIARTTIQNQQIKNRCSEGIRNNSELEPLFHKERGQTDRNEATILEIAVKEEVTKTHQ